MYQVSRNGQFYGPYSLEELTRYLASGNVLPGDLARSAEMAEWLPVEQILGQVPGQLPGQLPAQLPPQPFAPPAPGLSPYPGDVSAVYPDPPNLHWGLYLLLSLITFTLFSKVFTVVQAVWLKRVQPNSNGLYLYIGYYVLYLVSLFAGLGQGISYLLHPSLDDEYHGRGFGWVFVARVILLVVTRFVMSASLDEHFNTAEPIGLRLNPVLTFFFGGVYFQSQFNRINQMRQAARYGQTRAF